LPLTGFFKSDINSKADIVRVEHRKDAGTVEDKPVDYAAGDRHLKGEQTTKLAEDTSVSGELKFIDEVLDPGIHATEDAHNKYTALRGSILKRLEDKAPYGSVSALNYDTPRIIRQKHLKANAPLREVFAMSGRSSSFIILLDARAQHDTTTLISLNTRR
jgi:hypothetical protein